MSVHSEPVDPSRDGRHRWGEARTLVEFPQEELIAKWEEFFEEMGYLSKIISVADRYPEERSLAIAFDELNRFDTDMAIYLLRHPLNVLNAGEEAIRRLVPPGEEAALIHLRVRALPRDRRIPIRDLRAKHLGQYIAVEGLEVTEEDARLIREAGSSPDILRMITASIAPSMYGMHVEKEALALQLFSGVPKLMPDGRRIRGDIHVL